MRERYGCWRFEAESGGVKDLPRQRQG